MPCPSQTSGFNVPNYVRSIAFYDAAQQGANRLKLHGAGNRREIRTHDQRPTRKQIARASRSTEERRAARGERAYPARESARAQLLRTGKGGRTLPTLREVRRSGDIQIILCTPVEISRNYDFALKEETPANSSSFQLISQPVTSEGLSSSAVDRSWRDLSLSAVQLEGPEFEYSELSLKVCGSRYCELEFSPAVGLMPGGLWRVHGLTSRHLRLVRLPGWVSSEVFLNRKANARHTELTPDIMLWGAIGFNYKSPLVITQDKLNARQYINRVINPVVVPLMMNTENGKFQHENSRPHTAVITVDALEHVTTVPWPTRSPDLSPIKHLRDMVCLRSLMLAGNEFQSLGRAIVKEDEYEEVRWDGIVSIVSWRERLFRLWWEER
ncbi:hypothetical protein ANN_24998 [Periplaneta americana]|uniref:Uncharacterized protein n=1 Tax=Periplaneta americana TaxID=6978 RepID=A0ABQ8S067_PERAM|nr:hypothetical protein ANN_24998 [Periplaneta americana]